MQCGQNVQLLDVKLLVRHVTGRLYMVKYILNLKPERISLKTRKT
jgi:hypothetical protein